MPDERTAPRPGHEFRTAMALIAAACVDADEGLDTAVAVLAADPATHPAVIAALAALAADLIDKATDGHGADAAPKLAAALVRLAARDQ